MTKKIKIDGGRYFVSARVIDEVPVVEIPSHDELMWGIGSYCTFCLRCEVVEVDGVLYQTYLADELSASSYKDKVEEGSCTLEAFKWATEERYLIMEIKDEDDDCEVDE